MTLNKNPPLLAPALGNHPPEIISIGGKALPIFTLSENKKMELQVIAEDVDGDANLKYSIYGEDADLFVINPNNGLLAFRGDPSYESPLDFGRDNIYNVTVYVSDGPVPYDEAVYRPDVPEDGLIASMGVSVTLTDANDAPTGLPRLIKWQEVMPQKAYLNGESAKLPTGEWIKVWAEGLGSVYRVYSQKIDEAGNPLGDSLLISDYPSVKWPPSVAVLPDGGWIVTWESSGQDFPYSGIYGQRFAASGEAVGSEFIVGAGGQDDVAALQDGGWVVVYDHVLVQLYTADGLAISGPFAVNDGVAAYPSVAVNTQGNIIVAWHNYNAPNDDIYQTLLDPAGRTLTPVEKVNTNTRGAQSFPSVSALSDGGWLVTWKSYDGMHGQAYNGFGEKQGEEFLGSSDSAVLQFSENDFTVGHTIYADSSPVFDEDGIASVNWRWQRSIDNGITWANIPKAGIDRYLISQDDVGSLIRCAMKYVDGNGNSQIVYGQPSSTVQPAPIYTLNGTEFDDNLFGTNISDNISGLSGNDTLRGSAGGDTLAGGDGNDTLQGGAGDDALDGGTGTDTADYADSLSAVTVDLGIMAAQNTKGAGSDTLTSIENLTGSSFADALTGNGLANVLAGGDGTDVLKGNAGSDALDGGAGADRMFGGSGNDTYYIDGTGDRVYETATASSTDTADLGGTDTVNSSIGYTLGKFIENLTLTGSGNFSGTGNELANALVGNDGTNILKGLAGNDTLKGGAGSDKLDGGVGADTMFGGAGNDIYYVENAEDRVYETASVAMADSTDLGGKDTVSSSVGFTLGKFVENLTLTGTGNHGGSGNELANTLLGNDGANTLRGLGGSDILKGGAGNDKLLGGDGKDTLTGGAGNDAFVFDTASTNRDTITDFSRIEGDKIQLSRAVFTGFAYTGALHAEEFHAAAGATKAHDATDRLIYNTTTGVLFYDADGVGGASAVQVAQLGASTHPALVYADLQIIA